MEGIPKFGWGDEVMEDPLPPVDPFGHQMNHVPQWVFRRGWWVDMAVQQGFCFDVPLQGARYVSKGLHRVADKRQDFRYLLVSGYFHSFFS